MRQYAFNVREIVDRIVWVKAESESEARIKVKMGVWDSASDAAMNDRQTYRRLKDEDIE